MVDLCEPIDDPIDDTADPRDRIDPAGDGSRLRERCDNLNGVCVRNKYFKIITGGLRTSTMRQIGDKQEV